MDKKINLPKLTIITVTLNLIKDGRIDFFEQCLRSVHSQTYKNIEHLVIDGASTDGTLKFLEKYKKKGWINYYSEADKGMWDAMNKGIRKAKGDFIAFLNSDDYYADNDIIKACMKKIIESCADYSFANQRIIQRFSGDVILEAQALPVELFYIAPTYHHETLICKKSIYEKLNYYDEKYKTAIDYDFNIKLILNDYRYIHIDKIMIVTRIGGATSTIEGAPSEQTFRNVTTLFIDYFGKFFPLDYKVCCNMLDKHIYPEGFLNLLRNWLVLKNLKNFNYNFFIDHVGRTEMTNSMLSNKKILFSKEKMRILGIPLTLKRKGHKLKVYFLGIPIFKKKLVR